MWNLDTSFCVWIQENRDRKLDLVKLTITERGEEYITMFKPAPIVPTALLRESPCKAKRVVVTAAAKITTSKITARIAVLAWNRIRLICIYHNLIILWVELLKLLYCAFHYSSISVRILTSNLLNNKIITFYNIP